MRLALDAARMGTWERNLLTGEDFWSEQEEVLFGLAPGSFGTTHRSFLDLVHPEDRPTVEQAARRAIEGTGRYRSEFRILRPDGSVHWMAGRGEVIRDENGNAVSMVGVTMDITDLKQAQEQAKIAKEQAETANTAKDQFLAVLSHELRTPLTPVLASVEMLERLDGLPEEVTSSLETIRRNVLMEARIIDDLLDLTRISQGKIEMRTEVVDAHASVRHALEVWQHQVEAKGLELMLCLSAEHHYVMADPARLQQIFWNLIGNAVKFTPKGGRISLSSSNTTQARLIVQVADTGIGIDPNLLPRVFNAFEQGERMVTRRYGGLGLGLSISRAIAELHHGTLNVASDGPNTGATFTLSLGTVPASTSRPHTSERPGMTAEKTVRILLVEDHDDTLRVMARLLQSKGYVVSAAADLRAAHELLNNQSFDLVISDLALPDGSGLDFIRKVKNKHNVRAIALSGFGMQEDIRHSVEAGFDFHLTKPVNFNILQKAISDLTTRTD